MPPIRCFGLGCILGSVLFLFPCTGAVAGQADELKALVEQGRSKDAYDLGTRHPESLGEPDFDFFFGVAAVNAGHAGEGVLALERYLLRFPANTVARVELARAYFVLGEDARAREEFQNVLRDQPPANLQTTVERYLDAIRARESRYQTTASFYLEVGGGIDSNVNGGVGGANINLPVLGNVTVSNAGVRKGDNFTHLAAGGQISHPISPGVAIFGSIGVESKGNSSQTAFDLFNSAVNGGVSYLKDKDLYRVSLSQNTLTVENDRFRTVTGGNFEWNHQLDELQSLQASLLSAKFEYPSANQVRNADYLGGGMTYRRAFVTTTWQPVLSLGGNYAEERNKQQRPDLGRNISGVRLGLGLSPDAKWGLNMGLSYQESKYNGPDALLTVSRRDAYLSYDLSAVYLINRNMSVRGELMLSDNRSNISLYRFTRDVLAVKFRYEFK
jgi:hypothetical protein